ncbi:MAG: DUF1501 domain-containing protein [Methylophilaceae bacterium]
MNRRDFIRWSALSGLSLAGLPSVSFAAANTDRRFIFIIQRGAADGLNTVIPYADSAYKKLRGALTINVNQATKLDGIFALHPSLKATAKLYQAKQAMFVHAVASPYRSRSHFDAQNVLETGGKAAYQFKDGWMNRMLHLLPPAQNEAIAIASSIPMALRGKMNVNAYAPSNLRDAPDDLLIRVGELYSHDPLLNSLWTSAMEANDLAGDTKTKLNPAGIGKLTAQFLNKVNGPRIAMIESGGWDTHSAQNNRLKRQLSSLDTLINALQQQLGKNWQKTTILVATEFGRTAAANGTGGTDHGTASVAMLMGGDLNGGRVLTDWPGLNQNNLFQGRDLNPTLNLNTLISSTLGERFGLDSEKVASTVFPSTSSGKLMSGLINT